MSKIYDPMYVFPSDPLASYYEAKEMVYRLCREIGYVPLTSPEYENLRKMLETAIQWYKDSP